VSAPVYLILGGARSGKSAFAERLARHLARPVLYLATATPGDPEMAARIAAHRAARPPDWRTVESPQALAEAVRRHARPGDTALVDCLTLWLSNLLVFRYRLPAEGEVVPEDTWREIEREALQEIAGLIAAARARDAALILVSNEVGMGIVPSYPLGRRYRDLLGRVNQAAARRADSVILVIAGMPIDLRRLVPEVLRPLIVDAPDPPSDDQDGSRPA
jgi:adenosylcobinamide kinase/adenosylcobinamide-phosphate guanylyltransferase